jgi:hypothetical protein
VYAEEI